MAFARPHFALSRLVPAAALLLTSAGCAVPDAGPTFQHGVSQLAAERTGAPVRWTHTPEEQAQTEAAVRALLRGGRGGQLTADAAVRIALLNNRALQAEFEEVGISHAEFIQAGLLKNPEFAGSVRFPDRPPSATNLETALAGDVLDWFLVPLRRRLAGQALRQTELRVADEAIRLAGDVRRAFYMLQARRQFLVTLRAIAGTNEAGAEFTRQLREAGNVPELDLANARATLAQSRLDAAQMEAGLATDRERLNRLLGLMTDPGWRVGDHLPPLPAREPYSGTRLETIAVARRLDLEAARVGLDVSGQTLRLREGTRFFPAGIRFGVNSEREPDRQRVTGPTLQLELPIFDQGQAQVARLRAEARRAQRLLEERVVSIRADVREARAAVVASRRLAAIANDQLLPERRRVVTLTQEQYNAMLRGAPDLFLARQNALAAERSATEALRDYWIARADLERAVGGRLPTGKETVQL